MQQQMIQLAQIVDQATGSNYTQMIVGGASAQAPTPNTGAVDPEKAEESKALGGDVSEAPTTKKARERVAESTSPT